ncbi:MAG: nucleotide exchange factor GrpE [Chitinophagaceae bacterium]|nr:nucleotide exchange factor GrpE [Chitinophagaceae bacterium]MCW5904577.1 nucleotide exchange factor GrpE [Chitinophagaceae bacterium]
MKEKDLQANEAQENTMNINADENAAGTNLLNDNIEESETDKLLSELNEQKDKYLRLAAEFDNFRKRTSKEKLDLIQTAGKDVITALLDVLDDIDRAENQLNSNADFTLQKEGVQLVFNKVRSTLQSRGLKVLESFHTDFDTEKHEAISEIPAPTEELKGKVLDEIVKGYYLNDKLIRFAKVVVGK